MLSFLPPDQQPVTKPEVPAGTAITSSIRWSKNLPIHRGTVGFYNIRDLTFKILEAHVHSRRVHRA
jgi:hypothetical protein